MVSKRPKNLFKYLSFSDRLLQQLCYDQVYFADPVSFNDPLDCLPVVEADLAAVDLEALLAQLVLNRSAKEIDAAMKKLRLRGEKAMARREKLTDTEVRRLIGNINYHATNPDLNDPQTYICNALSREIERELRGAHETGVFCLSAKFDSPLMWSHYADQHRGVCVEYGVSSLAAKKLHPVAYGDSRKVKASQIRNWILNDDSDAQQTIDKISLLTKSKEWAYEREWRLLGPVGLNYSPISLKSVIFGMRCPQVIRYTIVRALEGRADIKFWEIAQPSDHFKLKRVRLNIEEMKAGLPYCSVVDEFENLDALEHVAQTDPKLPAS